MFGRLRARRRNGEGGVGVDRRRVLRAGAAAVAGAAVGGVMSASPADAAAGGNLILGGANDSGSTNTKLTAKCPEAAFGATNTSGGPALGATGHVVAAGGSVATPGHGAALDVKGRATFSRSGVVDVASGSIDVAVPGGLSSASRVFATTQGFTTQGHALISVVAAVPNPSTGKFTIFLSASPESIAPGTTVPVAWFVIG